MDDNRVILAIGRIEQAMSRIEKAARDHSGAPNSLADRHLRLRGATSAAIADLDRLLGGTG